MVDETLHSGQIAQGPRVEEFERLLRGFFGFPNVVTVNSCTSALTLALRIIGGEQVISTPMTCSATNMAALAAGYTIVWADVDPVSGNIDPQDVLRKVTHKTSAVLAVHWGGNPADVKALHKCGVDVVEDAAHAFGAEFHGQKIGHHSEFVCFSFQAIKHITTGDGGALLCRSDADHARARLLRWYGIDRALGGSMRCEEDIEEWGYKFHMNDIAAALGVTQMSYADDILTQRRAQAERYRVELDGVPGVDLIPIDEHANPSYWLYTIHVGDRAAFTRHMLENGVMVSQVHTRNDHHTAFRDFAGADLPGVDAFVDSMVCIPIGYWVSEADQDRIIGLIKEGW